MIIGKDFVILNMPKTGSTFRNWVANQYNYRCLWPAWLRGTKLTKFISRPICRGITRGCKLGSNKSRHKYRRRIYVGIYKMLHCLNRHPELLRRLFEIGRPHPHLNKAYNIYDFRKKEVFSVLRNPHSQAQSYYHYGERIWGKDKGKSRNVKSLNFAEYINTQSEQLCILRVQSYCGIEHINYQLGIISYQFIRMHFKDPVKIFAMSAEEFDEYCISDDYKEDMYPIKFFRTETMNRQLYEYLKSKPYLDSQIIDDIFKEAEPKNVSKKRTDAVWDEETKAYFEKTEKFYIRMVRELAPLPEDDF